MSYISLDFLENIYKQQKEKTLFGRWTRFDDIKKLLPKYLSKFQVTQIGNSEQNRPVMQLKIGNGKKKILIWSQMHGNENTGTKALFDLFNCFSSSKEEVFKQLIEKTTLFFIPMLNPDGAEIFSRNNVNNIDLNRDATTRIAIESRLLRKRLEFINPKFCFNLHDQRTIFGAEGTKNPATISFLAPSEDINRTLTLGRKHTMSVIVSINSMLQNLIPSFVGRYTDKFYPTATGDNFQKLGHNTILIESGHFPNDYDREVTRKYTFFSILQGLCSISHSSKFKDYKEYFNIPNNVEMFYDIIHRYKNKSIAYQFKSIIINDKLVSKLNKIEDKNLKNKIGHKEILFEK